MLKDTLQKFNELTNIRILNGVCELISTHMTSHLGLCVNVATIAFSMHTNFL